MISCTFAREGIAASSKATESREGVVLGVTGEGALQVRCAGEIIEFIRGEVSLRPTAGPG